MSTNPAVNSARENARRPDGRFGEWSLDEADVDMSEFTPEAPTVNVRGIDYEVVHDGGPSFHVIVDGKQVHFEADHYNDDLIEEAAVLAVDSHLDRQWGTVNVTEGSRTPWGSAQYVSRPAPGIVSVGTAGHGGIKLSPERNAEIPAPLRKRSGWYEEDTESNIVGMFHPEAFPHYRNEEAADQNEWRRSQCEAAVKNWFPDEYEKATGKAVPVEESSVLQRRAEIDGRAAFRAAHANEYVSLGNGLTPSALSNKWIPDGYAVTEARIDATGETRHFLVPQSEVIENKMWGAQVVLDPSRHLDVSSVFEKSKSPNESRPTIAGENLGIDYSNLKGRSSDAARGELDKQYRWNDGSVYSLGEHLAEVGVTHKVQVKNGTYFVQTANGTGFAVKKATADALTGVPDVTSDLDLARIEARRASADLDKVNSYDRDAQEKARTRLAAARARVAEAEAADRAANPLAYHEGVEEARAAEFERLVADKGISFD